MGNLSFAAVAQGGGTDSEDERDRKAQLSALGLPAQQQQQQPWAPRGAAGAAAQWPPGGGSGAAASGSVAPSGPPGSGIQV